MPYVNRCNGRDVETIDSAETMREAQRLAAEYNLADPSASYVASSRACKEWREAEREAARPLQVEPGRAVPAYHDSFAGLIPCFVTSAKTDGHGQIKLRIRYTGRRENLPAQYKAGEVNEQFSHHIVPRSAVRFRRHGTRVLPFAWIDSFPELRTLRGVKC